MKKLCGASLGTSFAVDGSTYNASGVACTLAARVESFEANMAERVGQTCDADRSRGAGFDADDRSLIGQETMTLTPEATESFLQARSDEVGHPEMKGRGNKTWSVATLGEVVAQTSTNKVNHSLCRSCLSATALLPGETFKMLLEEEHAKSGLSLRPYLHYHTRVTPASVAVTGTHSVDNDLLRTCGGGHNETTGTHAERIDAAALALLHKTVLCSGEVGTAPRTAMVLNLVNEL